MGIIVTVSKEAKEYENISGIIERITFHNTETGFCVLKVHVKGHKELVAVVGTTPSASAGEYVQCGGEWKQSRDHGLQFSANFIKAVPPNTKEGMAKYLGSGLIKGIGPNFAKRLVDAFGEEIFDVIENTPEKLTDVQGIGAVRAKKITHSWSDQKVVREIMVFLQSHGVTTTRATRIYKTYGDKAIQIVSDNPYRLAQDIRGIGFLTADTIAQNLGIQKDSVLRARAGLSHVLLEASSDGHCGLPEQELLQKANAILEIPEGILCEALEEEVGEQRLIRDTLSDQPAVFLSVYYTYEQRIAKKLLRIGQGDAPCGVVDTKKFLAVTEKQLAIKLSESQREAVKQALASKLMVITGGPGTGKTTLVRSVLTIFQAVGMNVLLCAPTGRAAKRLHESCRMEAKTIHRLLAFDPAQGGFKHNEDNLLTCHYLIIDESSMVDVSLMHALLKALPEEAGLILVGDVDQLPSVGAGQVLSDIIRSQHVPVITLTDIFRQAKGSDIIMNAHRVNKGIMPVLEHKKDLTDFYFIEADSSDDVVEKVLYIVKERIPKRFGVDSVKDIQVLCPLQRGGMGARLFNVELQKTLNPDWQTGIEKYGQQYAVGDKVMQIENDYDKEVYNGDLGFIEAIDAVEQEMSIWFDGRKIIYDFSDLDTITLAYATTIHKSQGSEYPVVVFPITMKHYMMLKRNLVYTGLTRGKKLVVLVGEKKALWLAVKNKQASARYTKLCDYLAQAIPENESLLEDATCYDG